MTLSTIQKRILTAADHSYQGGEADLTSQRRTPPSWRGDTLADFLAVELVEVTERLDGIAAVERAIKAVQTARDELDAVTCGLWELFCEVEEPADDHDHEHAPCVACGCPVCPEHPTDSRSHDDGCPVAR